MYHIEKPFLMSALSTITTTRVTELTDHSMQIVSTLLVLTERSSSFAEYTECYYGVTQVLILKLFELSSAG